MRIGIAHPFLRTRRDDRQRTAVRSDHARGASDSEAITRIFKNNNAETARRRTRMCRVRAVCTARRARGIHARVIYIEIRMSYIRITFNTR